MNCSRCGAEVNDTLMLCPKCGNILKDPNKEKKNNAFNSGAAVEKKVVINPYLPNPSEVKRSTLELLGSVCYHLTNLIYIAIITFIFVFVKYIGLKYNLIDNEIGSFLYKIGSILILNIPLALIFEFIFYKIDIPIGFACVPGINFIIYLFNGLNAGDNLGKYTIELGLLVFILSKLLTSDLIPIAVGKIFAILVLVLSIILWIMLIIFVVRCNYNYSIRFGFSKIISGVFGFLAILGTVCLPLWIIVIFSKKRIYKL